MKDIENLTNIYNSKLNLIYLKEPQIYNYYLMLLKLTNPNSSDKDKQNYYNEIKTVFKIPSINISTFIKKLQNKTKPITELKLQYEKALKELSIDKDLSLYHVSTLSPERLNGYILPKKNLTMYEESEDSFVFATTSEIKKLLYCGRGYNNGMIRIDKNTMIYGSDNNFSIENNKLLLKEPVFCYELNINNFNPVTSINKDVNNNLKFNFDYEWVSKEKVDLKDVKNIEKVDDLTKLLDEYQIYCNATGDSNIAYSIRNCKTKDEQLLLLDQYTNNKSLKNINKEVQASNNFLNKQQTM